MEKIAESTDGLSIAAVERETGISKDALRVWERRYGFPIPTRNAFGERVYPATQVGRLRMIRRLMDQGMRPGRIFALAPGELQALAAGEPPAARSALHDLALYLVKTHQSPELRRELGQAVVRDGLFRFVTETAAPLAALVGEAWMRGEIQVFEEHLFTEQMQGVLRQAIAQVPTAGGAPRVLLSTLPGEQHGLGLLMAEAACALEGAQCISLGIQTPVSELVAAARANVVDVVALSFCGSYPAGAMREGVQLLRRDLPAAMALWCGGAGAARLRHPPAGVLVLDDLASIGAALLQWRGTHEPE
jgi:DNA-binding transcriptional MerR regulator/methylmalonyl-CoA mutase cobalamin-binding subunit